jgi:hypothetical protein
MSELEVTYSTVNLHKSSGLQKLVRHEETQGPREAGNRSKYLKYLIAHVFFKMYFKLLNIRSTLSFYLKVYWSISSGLGYAQGWERRKEY